MREKSKPDEAQIEDQKTQPSGVRLMEESGGHHVPAVSAAVKNLEFPPNREIARSKMEMGKTKIKFCNKPRSSTQF